MVNCCRMVLGVEGHTIHPSLKSTVFHGPVYDKDDGEIANSCACLGGYFCAMMYCGKEKGAGWQGR